MIQPDDLPVSAAFDNEIGCVSTSGGRATVWRFAHTRAGSAYRNGHMNLSQDGRFISFNSDWEGTLANVHSSIVELR